MQMKRYKTENFLRKANRNNKKLTAFVAGVQNMKILQTHFDYFEEQARIREQTEGSGTFDFTDDDDDDDDEDDEEGYGEEGINSSSNDSDDENSLTAWFNSWIESESTLATIRDNLSKGKSVVINDCFNEIKAKKLSKELYRSRKFTQYNLFSKWEWAYSFKALHPLKEADYNKGEDDNDGDAEKEEKVSIV